MAEHRKKASKARDAPAPSGGAPRSQPKPRLGAGASDPEPTGALAEHEVLFCAAESFIRGNATFESSVPINAAVDEAGQCADLGALFAIPLQHKLFAMDTALRWVLFLSVAPGRAVQEGDALFSAQAPFSAQEALALLAVVYDVGVQEAVWEYFEPEDNGEDDEDDADA
jgi:hypothetical protein